MTTDSYPLCTRLLDGLVFNLPLVLVAAGGIVAAMKTLNTLKRQTKATEDAASAAKASVELAKASTERAEKSLVQLNRAYLTVDNWMPTNEENMVGAKFRVYNPSLTAARIEHDEVKYGDVVDTETPGVMLTPKESRWFIVTPTEMAHGRGPIFFLISGRLTYQDIFHKVRHRKFAKMWCCSSMVSTFEDVSIPNANDEEEWSVDS